MTKLYLTILLLTLTQLFWAQTANISDANFKDALLSTNCVDVDGDGTYDDDADTNDDGEIQLSEAEAITTLNISFNKISSLEGIEYFKNLKTLYCHNNRLDRLDLSQNTELESLYCNNNFISFLDLSSHLNLKTLDCHINEISTIDISKNPNLVSLSCYSNQLMYLNTFNNPNLEILNCWGNQLKSLDLSKNTKLIVLFCYLNQLTSLNVKSGHNTTLTTMWSQINNGLTCIEVDNIDYSKNAEGWVKAGFATYSENCTVLGIDDLETESQIICYPNPVNNILNIKNLSSVTIKNVKIYSTTGALLLEERSQFEQVDLSHLSTGLFLVAIETDTGSFMQKIVKN